MSFLRLVRTLRLQAEAEFLEKARQAVEHGTWSGDTGALADFMRHCGVSVPRPCGQHCSTCRRCAQPCRQCDAYRREWEG